jgi:hypothetical protein
MRDVMPKQLEFSVSKKVSDIGTPSSEEIIHTQDFTALGE